MAGPYDTVAGYMLSALGRVPRIGDQVVGNQARAVSEVEGHRISRLRVTKTPETNKE